MKKKNSKINNIRMHGCKIKKSYRVERRTLEIGMHIDLKGVTTKKFRILLRLL